MRTVERAGVLVCSEHNNCACPQRMAVAWETFATGNPIPRQTV